MNLIQRALTFPSFNFDMPETPAFQGTSIKNIEISDEIQIIAEDTKEQSSSMKNQLFLNEDNLKKVGAEEGIESKSGMLGIFQDLKFSENLSFTPHDSSENSEKGFNNLDFEKGKNKLEMDSTRKRYSNQEMIFQR